MATRKTASKKKTTKKPAKRSYNSPLREQQQEQTRQLIVEALAEQVWKEGLSDFSVPKVAKRAGVAVRTIYRYFPTRDDLLAAVQKELKEKHPEPEMPEDLAELPDFVPALYGYFDDNRAMIEAALTAGLASELHSKMRAERQARARKRWASKLEHLEDKEQRQLAALLRVIGGSSVWRSLTTQMGLSNDEAIELVQWLHKTALKEIGFKKGKPTPASMPWGEKR